MLTESLALVPVWTWYSSFVALVLVAIVKRNVVLTKIVDIISAILHIFLCRIYPINNVYDNTPLPTVPYRWPNGQGDVAKFLEGEGNSSTWEKGYGQLYRIWSGFSSEVVLTNASHMKTVFKDSDKHIKAVNNNSGYLLGEILGRCVGLISQGEWQRVRAITEVPFTHTTSKNYHTIIAKHVDRHFRALHAPDSENPSSGHLAKGLIDPAEDLKMLPFWIVAEIVYGELSLEQEVRLRNLAPHREELFKHVIRGGLSRFPISRFFNTKANRSLYRFKVEWKSFSDDAFVRAQTLPEPPPIVNIYRAREQGKITEDQVHHTLDEVLYANLDVTTGALSWNVVFLAAYPEEQRRLREEVLKNSGNEAMFNAYLESSSTFMAACISESSRLKPLAAFSVPQAAPTPRTVDGFLVPANTTFLVDSYALNIRNPYWGADRTAYRPARFLELPATETRYNFWRFGFGPRQCMGKYTADLLIRRTLAKLVLEYELSMVETGGQWAKNPDMWITHPQMKLQCVKRKAESDKLQ